MMNAIHIEQGLTHNSSIVRSVFAERNDFTPTPEQIERGLTDTETFVRMKFAKRKDFTPTAAQIERGLMDSNPTIRMIFAAKQAEWLREQFQPETTQRIRKVL
jgi:hypothetical protein